MIEKVKTFCSRICGGNCGIFVKIIDGRISYVESDPDCQFNRGHICPKGRAIPELLYHPDRIKLPLKRVSKKGEGRWEQISVDEALDVIARKLEGYIEQFGAESILLYTGAYRGLERAFIQRFASAMGTPNTATIDNLCHAPRTWASIYTTGQRTYPDYDHPPKCLIIWGRNSPQTNGDGLPAQLRAASDKGTKLIVIDPRKIPLASRAEIWIKPRPGSDGLLALGMLNVIVYEELYDKEFVDKWTVGFNELRDFLVDYQVKEVAEKTWVPENQIKKAAQIYAKNRPASIQWGNALDQTSNTFQTCRAIEILRAVTGNIDVPGGEVFQKYVPVMNVKEFSMIKGSERYDKTPIGKNFKVAAKANIVPSQETIRAILEEDPYPLKAAMIFGSNPMLTYANAEEAYKALMKIDFLVVAELFMTPTAALADVVLPVAANLEYDDLVQRGGYVAVRPKIVEPPGVCKSDLQWMNLIAGRMGFGHYFWKDEVSAIDTILKPAGLTFEGLKERGLYCLKNSFRKYEMGGFKTPSGKVELFSRGLRDLGIDPLPTYREPLYTPFGSPDLVEEYPLVFTSHKNPFFYHASHRNIPSLRKLSPEPVAELNPETAREMNLSQGDFVFIENPLGRIRQRLRTNSNLDPRVVVVSYGWWFPERGVTDLYGWREANLNILTDNSPPFDPAMGAVNLRGLICKVYKA